MDPDITRIVGKLRQVRRRRPKAFGSRAHGFVLEKPYPEARVQAFEQRHGITLPEDFRRFILQAGATGAAPTYGLLPMERWAHGSDATRLARDCPMYPGLELTDEELASDHLKDRLEDGAITIIHGGCSDFFLLIVTGPWRGRVVLFDDENAGHPYFPRDTGFLAWYERWLDELLAGWDVAFFSYGLPGDARKMIEVLTSPDSSDLDRVDALQTVGRIPKLDETLTHIVLRGLTDREARVRKACAWLTAQKKISGVEPALLALCTDPEAPVRKAALEALWRFKSKAWPERARLALRDSDENVVYSMLIRLARKYPLNRSDLEPLVVSASPKVRRSAVWLWGASGFKFSDTRWFEARLHDDDSGVRRELIRAAREARDQAAVPRLSLLPEWTPEMASHPLRDAGHWDARAAAHLGVGDHLPGFGPGHGHPPESPPLPAPRLAGVKAAARRLKMKSSV